MGVFISSTVLGHDDVHLSNSFASHPVQAQREVKSIKLYCEKLLFSMYEFTSFLRISSKDLKM